jgi:hypothetical protein
MTIIHSKPQPKIEWIKNSFLQNSQSLWFLDFKYKISINSKLDVECKISNLLNNFSVVNASWDSNLYKETSFNIRPRQLLFNITWGF